MKTGGASDGLIAQALIPGAFSMERWWTKSEAGVLGFTAPSTSRNPSPSPSAGSYPARPPSRTLPSLWTIESTHFGV
jgi:hypothetical protein